MGFFDALMGSVGKAVGEQLFPVYENAIRWNASDLEREVKSTSNKPPYHAVYLLALFKRNKNTASKIYKADKQKFENIFTQLYNYRRFQPVINEFRTIASRDYY